MSIAVAYWKVVLQKGEGVASPPEVALAKLTESLRLLERVQRCLAELRRVSTSPELRTADEELCRLVYGLDGLRLDIEQAARQRHERKG
ncbi:MAG: hypothetical protein PHV43_03140 [Candidatus Colwellbacteria bacterium]|nr:hypothetical protein [Candidatus Colwellbacteria bacterium]